jgi:hypothetical protein
MSAGPGTPPKLPALASQVWGCSDRALRCSGPIDPQLSPRWGRGFTIGILVSSKNRGAGALKVMVPHARAAPLRQALRHVRQEAASAIG